MARLTQTIASIAKISLESVSFFSNYVTKHLFQKSSKILAIKNDYKPTKKKVIFDRFLLWYIGDILTNCPFLDVDIFSSLHICFLRPFPVLFSKIFFQGKYRQIVTRKRVRGK